MYIWPHLRVSFEPFLGMRYGTHSEHSPRAATSFPATVAFSLSEISSDLSEISTRAATALATTVGL